MSPRERSEESRVLESTLEVEVLSRGNVERVWPLLKKVLIDEHRLMPERSLRTLWEGETRSAGTEILVTGRTEDPAGCLVLSEGPALPVRTALVSLWAVDPDRRGHGAGRELLRVAIARVRQKGIPCLRVRTFATLTSPVRVLWSLGFRVRGLDVLAAEPSRELLVFERALGTGSDEREGG